MSFLPPDQEPVTPPQPGELVPQPTAMPTRKWNYGALGSAIIIAAIAGLTAYDPQLGATWGPLIGAIAGALGFAIPAYAVKNRA